MEENLQDIKDALREVLDEETGTGRCDIAPKWDGGSLVLQPFDEALKGKEIPLSIFFKKLTSVREKLRVIEQKLNNHSSLSSGEKAEFQTLITRCYGSLTTFNVLFRDKDDCFAGMKE